MELDGIEKKLFEVWSEHITEAHRENDVSTTTQAQHPC
jgi:hypothetical protein